MNKSFNFFTERGESQCRTKIKRLHSDNGGKYVNREMKLCCFNSETHHTTKARCSPQFNGLARRTSRSILELKWTMLDVANLDKRFWAEAVHYAVYLQNLISVGNCRMAPEKTYNYWKARRCSRYDFWFSRTSLCQ